MASSQSEPTESDTDMHAMGMFNVGTGMSSKPIKGAWSDFSEWQYLFK